MGRGQRTDGVRKASDSTIEIDFRYRGLRCRERLSLPPTARNMSYAANLRGQVLIEIAKGLFDYAKTFPNSTRAARFSTKPSEVRTMREALLAWYTEKEQELEHSSLLTYKRVIHNVLIPALGDRPLIEFNRPMVKDLLATLKVGLSGKRLGNILCPLRGVADEAVRDEVLKTSPMEGFKVKRRRKAIEDHDDVDPFAPAEVRAILAGCTDPQFANYCRFAFASGLRTGELIGLRWTDVDLVAGTVAVRRSFVMGKMKSTKTTAGYRVVSLIPTAVAALRAQQEHTRLAGGAVFHNPRTGEAWDGDRQIREHYWRLALKRAGVRYRYPYQMRHTYASQALSAGENVMWVAAQLGHKDWAVTARRYARWIPSAVPDAGGKLAAVWAAAEGA